MACHPGTSPAVADEARTPMEPLTWLANSDWDCVALAQQFDHNVVVDHHWAFGATTYTTDLPAILMADANRGDRSYADTDPFGTWVIPVSNTYWKIRNAGDGRYSSTGPDIVFLELHDPADTDGGQAFVMTFRRYTRAGGEAHLVMSGLDASHVVDCVAASSE